jgi:hypothetical protein
LVVDGFGIKYMNRTDADHLLVALQELHEVTNDWSGTLFLDTTITWDYHHGTVYISLPCCVSKSLERFQHQPTGCAQHSPRAWTRPQYGRHPQLTPLHDDTEPLIPAELTHIQEIVNTLLFRGRIIDCTVLVALDTVNSSHSKGTQANAQAITQLLNYAAAHLDVVIRYTASNMYLHIHSDASYLSDAQAKSRAGGTFFISSKPSDPNMTPTPTSRSSPHNGAIHTISSILHNAMASATEAELNCLKL